MLGYKEFICTDAQGNVLSEATVTVYYEGPGEVAAPIYSDREGEDLKANPFTTGEDGVVSFFAVGGAYRVVVEKDDLTVTRSYVAVGLLQEQDEVVIPPNTMHVEHVITSSQEFVPTPGAIGFEIEVQAPGGGSGGADGAFMASGAGGGGEYARGMFTPDDIGESISVTIGAAGTAGNNSGSNGGTGGTTSVGSLISCVGGGGGAGTGSNSTDDTPRNGGEGGTGGTGGTVRIPGQRGGSPAVTWVGSNHFTSDLGKGGDSFLGKGSRQWLATAYSEGAVPGRAGGAYGGGAAGAFSISNTGQVGAAGGVGVVIIREFF